MANIIPFPTDAVYLKDGHAITTSLKVAEVFGKQHKDVLKSIKRLDCSEEFAQRNFAPSCYVNSQNKSQPMYEMTRNGFTFLAMGYTGAAAAKYKEDYIRAFDMMVEELTTQKSAPVMVEKTIPVREAEYWRMRAELAEMKLEHRTRKNADFEEETKIVELVQSGKGPTEIAKEIGRTKSGAESVIKRLRKEGRL